MKTIKIEFVEDGAQVLVELLEHQAPNTCNEIWNKLPLEGELIHDIWSGPQLFLPLEFEMWESVYPENLTVFVHPGDVFFYARGPKELHGKPYGLDSMAEIGIVYDRNSGPKGPAGPKSINIFGKVIAGASDLKRLGDSVVFSGPKKVRISRQQEVN
ncbi:MAG TPA: DUF3830 family protein [bacterium]|nr:DUF3830 family protein [bacterium]